MPLGRRFRLKLWIIRSYGVEGLRRIIRNHINLAAALEQWIEVEPDFELMAPRSLALINFRYHPVGVDEPEELDRLNAALLERINDDGRIYLTQTGCTAGRSCAFPSGRPTPKSAMSARVGHNADIARSLKTIN